MFMVNIMFYGQQIAMYKKEVCKLDKTLPII